MKAMEDRFEARFEALEALIRQRYELNRHAYNTITKRLDDFEAVNRPDNDYVRSKLDMLVKRVDQIASELSVLAKV
ncbi:unnamed protein product [Dibothriocephalus latus]|uniref:Uncharacterized protein n=1 Tax=Dibothriocephalus latus TaxID=60516 RepID=A0A3P7NTP9_DIBLA|nr:unnamed protein product [Dibothriocephalus latus]